MDFLSVGSRAPVSLNITVASEKASYGFKPSQTIDVDFIVSSNATQEQAAQQAPARQQDIVLVLDVSGSMDGPLGGHGHSALGSSSRLDLVKNSCDWLLRNLPQANTSVGIVTFATRASKVHPLRPLDTHLESLLGSVSALHTEGQTNMWAGMELGCSILKKGSPQSQSSKIMIVLSDGEVNQGRQDIAAAVAETIDYTQMELWMFAVSSAANTSLCEAAVKSCGGTLIAISDPEAVPAAFGSFCGAERLAEQVSLTLTPSDATQFSVTSLSVQNRSSNVSQVQVALGFLMKDTPRHVLFRARVRIPAQMPSSGLLHIGSISSWCLAAAGDISVQIPLAIRLSPSADDGELNIQVSKAVQKEAVAQAMRSGNVQAMRALAEKLQASSAAAEFKSEIAILMQLAKDFEDRRDDARMNSMQMAQECSNNRSMQSATRFVHAKGAVCSPMVRMKSKAASDDVVEKMSKGQPLPRGHSGGQAAPLASPTQDLTSAFQQTPPTAQPLGAPRKQPPAPAAADAPAPGIVSSVLSGIRGLAASVLGASSTGPDMQ
jgi:Mg-chelatase subunit ChlD